MSISMEIQFVYSLFRYHFAHVNVIVLIYDVFRATAAGILAQTIAEKVTLADPCISIDDVLQGAGNGGEIPR